jgi:hypothetical protein
MIEGSPKTKEIIKNAWRQQERETSETRRTQETQGTQGARETKGTQDILMPQETPTHGTETKRVDKKLSTEPLHDSTSATIKAFIKELSDPQDRYTTNELLSKGASSQMLSEMLVTKKMVNGSFPVYWILKRLLNIGVLSHPMFVDIDGKISQLLPSFLFK